MELEIMGKFLKVYKEILNITRTLFYFWLFSVSNMISNFENEYKVDN